MKAGIVWVFLGLIAAALLAQTALTNDSIIRMAKAGLGEEIILSTVKSQPGRYATSPDDLIALKTAGVTDKVIAAMIDKMPAVAPDDPPPAAAAQAAAPASAASAPVSEVGVYYSKSGSWTDLPPEVVNFKTGGVLKKGPSPACTGRAENRMKRRPCPRCCRRPPPHPGSACG